MCSCADVKDTGTNSWSTNNPLIGTKMKQNLGHTLDFARCGMICSIMDVLFSHLDSTTRCDTLFWSAVSALSLQSNTVSCRFYRFYDSEPASIKR